MEMSTECPCPGSLQTPWLIQLEPSREGIPQDLKPPFRGVRGWLGSAGGTDRGGGPGDKSTPSSGAEFRLCLYGAGGALCGHGHPAGAAFLGVSRACTPAEAAPLRARLPHAGTAAVKTGVGLAGESRGRAPEKGEGSWGISSQRGHGGGKSRECLQPRSVSSAQLSQCPAAFPALVQAAWGGSVTPRTAPGWTGRGVSVITRV